MSLKLPATAAALLVSLVAGTAGAGPALAAPGKATLNVTLAQKTGTPGFDSDDAPGHDSSDSNDIVRTNDTVTYTASIRYEGADQTHPAITLKLPQGEELVQLPPFCRTGSSVTPASIGAPTIPVTATSYRSLPAQTVTCFVDDQSQGTALDYKFIAKVRPEVPNATALTPVTASATSDQVDTPAVSNAVEHKASAKANFDVSKRGTAVAENTGPYRQEPGVQPCAFDVSRFCRTVYYPLTVNTPPGGKGITPLASPVTLTDDLTPASFFGPAAWARGVAAAGSAASAIEAYAPRLSECRDVSYSMWGGLPWSRTASADNDSVTNSGTISCQQPGGPGTPVNIKITDADTTGYHVPTQAGSTNALPGDAAYVISYEIKLQVPVDAIRDLGIAGPDGVTKTLSTNNSYINVAMTDIAGNPNTGEVGANNNRTNVLSMRAQEGGAGEGFDKYFSSPLGRPGNVPIGSFSGQQGYLYEGPPGSGTAGDGNTVALPGQPVLSNLRFISTNGVPHSGTEFSRTYVGCDVWNDAQLGLTAGSYAASPDGKIRASNGAAAWISYFQNGIDEFQPLSDLRNLKIEYSKGSYGAGEGSDCSTGTWYSTPGAVPGALRDAKGVYSGVNRVRVAFSSDYTGNLDTFSVNLAIGQTVREAAGGIGDKIGNWGSRKWVEGLTGLEGVISDPKKYDTSTYDPKTHESSWGDRLTIGGVTARINKYVKNPSTGQFTDKAVPQYTAGAQVDYRLSPTLSADVPAGVPAQAIVEDCLPRYQQFLSSKRESGENLTPVLVRSGAPAESKLTCPIGQTYIKWDLGNLVVNTAIDPILYTVDILKTARNDVYTNTALISSPQDPSPVSVREDKAQIQLVLPTGVKIDKSATRPFVEINPSGIPTPRTLNWTVEFANIDSPVNVSDVDVIDVLPANSIGKTNYHGGLTFTSTAISAGTGIRTLYTATPPARLNADPDHKSNTASGATVWCDAISGAVVSGNGTAADCPTDKKDVTGLRFLRAGAFTPDDQMVINVVMTPTGNNGGDVYDNTTSGRAKGVTQPVGPASRAIKIIESSIGDFVWDDRNANGVQDPGEPGIAGFAVALEGKDLDGNPVNRTTTTTADGRYSFAGLASGTYTVTFDPNSLASNTKFTIRNAGTNHALDSDGDPISGKTAEFTLAPDSHDPSWDQGLIVDRNAAVTLDKKIVSQSKLDAQSRATTTYEIVVANSGTAVGRYDLRDVLKLGKGITINSVSASGMGSSIRPVAPDFDGVSNTTLVHAAAIGPGERHTYRVVVEATVATTITKTQRDCSLTDGETGTGYMNTAQLDIGGKTLVDTACGEASPPKGPSTNPASPTVLPTNPAPPTELPRTGGNIPFGVIAAGVLLIMVGLGIVLIGRRKSEQHEGK